MYETIVPPCNSSSTGRFGLGDVEWCIDHHGQARWNLIVPSTEAEASTVRREAPRQQFRCYRGTRPPRFVNTAERECAEILDFYGVPWEYEPVTFVLETDEDGRIAEAFSPDFYLPDQNLFLEVTTMRQELVTRKNRKVRKLRQRYPDVNIKLFYRRDIEALGQKLRARSGSLALPAEPVPVRVGAR
jgi:hypothetical protein